MIEILQGGMLTTVQDLGRTGYQRFGMPVAGAMDAFSLRLANILVGNDPGEAGLEATVMGPTLRFLSDAVFAVAGGDFGPTLNGTPIEMDRAHLACGGDELRLPMARRGARAYVAFGGGLDLPPVMGSRSTCLKAGLGGLHGRALRAGDRIGLRASGTVPKDWERRAAPPDLPLPLEDRVSVRFTWGYQADRFTAAGRLAFCRGQYTLSPQSDRMGYRLQGPRVETLPGAGSVISDGVCFGSIQITDGCPIVMMADRQTTGGYPKIGCVIGADLPLLSQLKAGDGVRFLPVQITTAQRAWRARLDALAALQRSFEP